MREGESGCVKAKERKKEKGRKGGFVNESRRRKIHLTEQNIEKENCRVILRENYGSHLHLCLKNITSALNDLCVYWKWSNNSNLNLGIIFKRRRNSLTVLRGWNTLSTHVALADGFAQPMTRFKPDSFWLFFPFCWITCERWPDYVRKFW